MKCLSCPVSAISVGIYFPVYIFNFDRFISGFEKEGVWENDKQICS
jgi:hypothetical protein